MRLTRPNNGQQIMLMAPLVHLDDGFWTITAGSMFTGGSHARECPEKGTSRYKGGLMRPRTGIAAFVTVVGVAGALAAAAGPGAQASTAGHPGDQGGRLIPGDLLVSTSDYVNDPNIVAGKTVLPPGSGSAGALAIANGNYPYVFNNDSVDGSFGVTSPLYLDEITPSGRPQDFIPVRSSELNTSFSSKSEGALNLSSDGKYVTFMDYVAAPDTVDVSNANTPGVIDPTNPVT